MNVQTRLRHRLFKIATRTLFSMTVSALHIFLCWALPTYFYVGFNSAIKCNLNSNFGWYSCNSTTVILDF